MSPDKLGSVVAATFGLVFVVVNGGPLPRRLSLGLGVGAAVALLGVLFAVRRRPDCGPTTERPSAGLSRGFWLVVAVEALAIVEGLALLRGPLHAAHAAVAWVSLVVGAHFFALAVLWKDVVFHWLGAGVSASGGLGLVLAAAGSGAAPVDLVAGVLPGAILLGFGLWGSTRGAPGPRKGSALRRG